MARTTSRARNASRRQPARATRAETPPADLLEAIGATAAQLRAALVPVLQKVAGARPRPTELTRRLGLDKSIASRLVRASKARTDHDLMHLVPSPAGLRILAESAAPHVGKATLSRLHTATRNLQALIDAAPGGRATLDARISQSSKVAREQRERIARQSSFKSMSFLIGYCSDILSTSLFIVPSEDGRAVDTIEISRRFGIRRLRPDTPVPILHFAPWPATEPGQETRFESIHGSSRTLTPEDLLLPNYCSHPLPRFVVVEGPGRTTVVLPETHHADEIETLSWAFRLRNGGVLHPGSGIHSIAGYLLHMPCRRLVRDLFIDERIYPEVRPHLNFVIPSADAHLSPPVGGGVERFADVHVSAAFEPLPAGDRAFTVPGIADHPAITREVLASAGFQDCRFRGWRVQMTYPLPLVQMMMWLIHPERPGSRTSEL